MKTRQILRSIVEKSRRQKYEFKSVAGSRFNEFGDSEDGRHVTEFEDEDLNSVELKQKQVAKEEGHDEYSGI
jgi:hypothetical protein